MSDTDIIDPTPTGLPDGSDGKNVTGGDDGGGESAGLYASMSGDEVALMVADSTYFSNSYLQIVLHVYIFALLADRIFSIKHRLTSRVFIAAVAVQIMTSGFNIVGNGNEWFFGWTGSIFFYFVRAVLQTVGQQLVIYLNYLRVAEPLRRLNRPWVRYVFLGIVNLNWLVVGAHEIMPLINYVGHGENQDYMFSDGLLYFSIVYALFIDTLLNGYCMRALYQSPEISSRKTGPETAHSSSGRGNTFKLLSPSSLSRWMRDAISSEQLSFFIAFFLRIVLFIAADSIYAVALIRKSDVGDVSMEGLVLWGLGMALRVLKPYLLVTDMARIRVLMAALPRRGQDANDGVTFEKKQGKASTTSGGNGHSHADGTKTRTGLGQESIMPPMGHGTASPTHSMMLECADAKRDGYSGVDARILKSNSLEGNRHGGSDEENQGSQEI
ncbi:uncharacterized protein EV422DRAFT_509395 [Fimicolochytrium jonesii]|uniref:uncharacterized protein n=1 Tax=Fimicolochytrium jonesii TaxID=1396493 RepID=UPI0022FEEAC7|nr:uncharacterized protein EV422DRAFT_509395 [Fimicolochytrium jonesii]KAI8816966.1 hypothetical protein EV422DRAFT_509395 [Fimicolochytrium jonesii]